MSSYLPTIIELHQSIPRRLGSGAFIGGSSYLDDQHRLEARLFIADDAGERDIWCHEGDNFEFAGATWKVTKIYHAYVSGRPRVATLSRIE